MFLHKKILYFSDFSIHSTSFDVAVLGTLRRETQGQRQSPLTGASVQAVLII